jgi:hypothetical protein
LQQLVHLLQLRHPVRPEADLIERLHKLLASMLRDDLLQLRQRLRPRGFFLGQVCELGDGVASAAADKVSETPFLRIMVQFSLQTAHYISDTL